ncbi:hypothetical protein Acr_14g0006290 [Actinidia rufa]|uniref:Uncharacterized protein n=1 Tax=Actinidia rufa TaxID=165716 RepID=A0A7J0FQX9_9ERIC|nr:hypothetical protein Acr_14g0006290 [Actinidia rufa]
MGSSFLKCSHGLLSLLDIVLQPREHLDPGHEVQEIGWKVEYQVLLEPLPKSQLELIACHHQLLGAFLYFIAVWPIEPIGTTLLMAVALWPFSLALKSPSWICLALSVSRRSTLVHSSDLLCLLVATILLSDWLSTLT